ncbi:peptidoglycan DD-metalloendopeptidase family protein [Ramlibacter sp. MAHUQ-53]|uniref:peptidoglycan DD-metalloendopeptidase family protein n=1 Tax=unclassified Ramlibacter TaxID=2617605 RepID=UPI00363200F3
MPQMLRRGSLHALVLLSVAALLAGCASGSRRPAPVEDRGTMAHRSPTSASMPAATAAAPGEPVRLPPGAENAGKPGYYTVRPGDTLIRISLDAGQNWRDVVRWNSLSNPNVIEVGQVLRIVPPVAAASQEVVTRPVQSAQVAVQPVQPASAASAPAAVPSSAPARADSVPAPAASADDDVAWAWPTGGGAVLAGFDEAKNKGLDIAGKAGDPVLAAADGRVVYAGSGLRGYGNLIILKHNNTYLTAYAHNQSLLVKEDQAVRKGQKIAEMGNSDADRVKLHFEIRRQGKPVDPSKYLPAR